MSNREFLFIENLMNIFMFFSSTYSHIFLSCKAFHNSPSSLPFALMHSGIKANSPQLCFMESRSAVFDANRSPVSMRPELFHALTQSKVS
mmetsp:Transcript_26436/g.86888  ORF Transcript_26436/g.86888 Transcript_26436/m.86888 type:complete len:90 (-) Transcript_26436:70-339(-)